MSITAKSIFPRLRLRQPPRAQTRKASLDLIASHNPSPDDVVRILSSDPLTALYVLKRANNAFYGLQGSVSSLTHAVEVLRTESTLAMMSAGTLEQDSNPALDAFIRHASVTAFIGHRLATGSWLWKGEHGAQAGLVFTAGLLHSLGRLAMCVSYPDEACALYGFSDKSFPVSGSFEDLEQLQFGADYAEVGEFIARKFRFSDALLGVIRNHKRPEILNAPESTPSLALIVAAASDMASAAGYGAKTQGSFLYQTPSISIDLFEASWPGVIQCVSKELSDLEISNSPVSAAHYAADRDTLKRSPEQNGRFSSRITSPEKS